MGFSGSSGASLGGFDGRKPLSQAGNRNRVKVVGGLAVAAASAFVLSSESLCPPSMRESSRPTPLISVSFLQALTVPLSLLSKAPQILSNYTNGSTGNLSAFAVFNALLGCLARLFTTKQEVNDPLIFWGFAGAGLLNAVLAIQMAVYWNSGVEKPLSRRTSLVEEKSESPAKVSQDGSRRWARKLD
jgi:mannose-P-dolichol utilization defect protein 1